MLLDILKSARPHQWVKNSFVLAPLVFSQNLANPALLAQATLATLLFCFGSSAVYIINDLFDREVDRAHPTKCNRPIASGRLSAETARLWVAILVVGSLTGAVLLRPAFAAVLAGYIVINLAYSLALKHVAFVDVTIIAFGFLLRILAGALAIDVPSSAWLVICTFLLSLYLALGKRKHELFGLGDQSATRKVLESYRPEHVNMGMRLTAAVTAIGYAAYTLDETTRIAFDTDLLVLGIPFIVFGLFRFFVLTQRIDHPESPTEQMIRDFPFLGNLVLWGILNVFLIYG
jgi:4-hydroxybenzoate polyprenyltransferase